MTRIRTGRSIWAAIMVAVTIVSHSRAAETVTATLRRQTQELFDAVTAGDSTVWDRYLAPDVIYVDEAGDLNSRAELLASIKPLPKDIWGKLVVDSFEVRPHGETAIATFVVNETEGYFGQVIHARYLTTNVWQRGARGWRMIGAHVTALRQDPPSIVLPADRLADYVGEYELTPAIRYVIRQEGDTLVGQRTGRPAETLRAEVADLFFVVGRPRLRKVFQRGGDGRVTGFVERRETWDVAWKRLAATASPPSR